MEKVAIKKVLEETKGKFFTVVFTKKDGSRRTLNGRMGVRSFLRGGENHIDKEKFVIVYDVKAGGYRAVNMDTVSEIRFKGIKQ